MTVRSGNILIADRDGVVIVPRDAAQEAVEKTEEVIATESDRRAAIIGGMDAEEAYLKFGKF